MTLIVTKNHPNLQFPLSSMMLCGTFQHIVLAFQPTILFFWLSLTTLIIVSIFGKEAIKPHCTLSAQQQMAGKVCN